MPSLEVSSPITGTVWKIVTQVGDRVEEDQPLVILESMKMEIPVPAPEDGVVEAIRIAEGDAIAEGDVIAVLRTD
ncbi:MAG: biotin/lipoyl-binding carrier protein [Proteobacteria bacterium]|nr:biotin/lipoyl-binding carrier protein [Pseudomonadota bacterium]